MYRVLTCLTTEHDWRLVVLAGTICWLASAVAISLFHRARASRGRTRAVWICLDAAVGGCGIWATHFVAMLAYDPGAGAGYSIPITLLSLVFAIAIVAIGLCIALSSERQSVVALGGAVIGGGVAAMHYTGMAALELPAFIVWSPDIVLTSIVLGSVFAAVALLVAVRRDNAVYTMAATGLLTVAIVSHHFTAMGAVTLIPDPTLGSDGLSISPTALSFLTAVAAFAILGLSLLAAMIDRRAKGELHQQKILLDTALDNMSQGLSMFDADGRILLYNDRYTEMMGRTGIALQGGCCSMCSREQKPPDKWDGDPDQFVAGVIAAAKAGKSATRMVSRNGRSIRVVHQPMKGGGWVATFEDITEWQAAQEQISHMARHDALTNLPNRTLFREQLEKALRLAKRSDQLAVFCLDLDHFKEINDSLGHPVGDALLKAVARRLGQCMTENDTVARLGGDEFAIVQFCNDCDPSAVALLASHMVEKISAPYEIAGHQLVIGVSIGISLAPEDGKNPDELLKKADLALYRAKADGRGTYRFFETGMDARAQARRHAGTGSARGAATRRIRSLLSADPRRRQGRRRCFRSPGALEPFVARHDRAGQFHSAGGRNRPDRSARRLGAASGLPGRGRMVAGCRRCRQSFAGAVQESEPGSVGEGGIAGLRSSGAIASNWRSRNRCCCRTARRRLRSCTSCAASASGSRWMISEPVIRR